MVLAAYSRILIKSWDHRWKRKALLLNGRNIAGKVSVGRLEVAGIFNIDKSNNGNKAIMEIRTYKQAEKAS